MLRFVDTLEFADNILDNHGIAELERDGLDDHALTRDFVFCQLGDSGLALSNHADNIEVIEANVEDLVLLVRPYT